MFADVVERIKSFMSAIKDKISLLCHLLANIKLTSSSTNQINFDLKIEFKLKKNKIKEMHKTGNILFSKTT